MTIKIMSFKKNILIFLGVCFSLNIQSQPNNLAQAPPMGWNSWNYFGKENINEKLIIEVIDAMAENKMNEFGYEYIVVDGGWRESNLGPNGELLVNEKFPSGMKFLADYAHSKGFKFGLHTVPGSHDCGLDKVGGWGYEETHVNQLIGWGVDFIKLDRCRFSLDSNPDYPRKDKRWFEGWGKNNENIEKAYALWSRLLRKSERKIVLSASVYRFYDWYPDLTNMGRTTGDIKSIQTGGAVFDDKTKKVHSVMKVAELNNKHHEHARPGYWNDPDMLVTGKQGLNHAEQKIHFALWCIMSSPLMLGNDPRIMSKAELDIITNKEAIRINQDPTEQGKRIKKTGEGEIWAKKLSDGSYGILFLNRSTEKPEKITLNWEDLNLRGKKVLKDVYENKELGDFNHSFTKSLSPRSGIFFTVNN